MQKRLLQIFTDLIKIDTSSGCEEGFAYIKNLCERDLAGLCTIQMVGDTHQAMIVYIPRKGYTPSNSALIDSSCPTIALCGHIDVVPADGRWRYGAFDAMMVDGRIYGRGTQDMKSGVAASLATLTPRDNINQILIIISDEESDSISTRAALSHLENLGIKIDFALVSEPTCTTVMGDSVKTARRGSIHATIDIYGRAGHVAYPHQCTNPVELLSRVLPSIAGHEFDEPSGVFEPSRIVINSLSTDTHISNVVPSKIHLRLNVRNTTSVDMQTIERYLVGVLDGARLQRVGAGADSTASATASTTQNTAQTTPTNEILPFSYELKLWQTSMPFCSRESAYIDRLCTHVERITGVRPQCNARGGTSDARFFAQWGIDVCEFGVLNDLIHQVDESVEFSQVCTLAQVIDEFLDDISRTMAGGACGGDRSAQTDAGRPGGDSGK